MEPIILEVKALVLKMVSSATLTYISENTGYMCGLELKTRKSRRKEEGV
jgi:hypothetical protein